MTIQSCTTCALLLLQLGHSFSRQWQQILKVHRHLLSGVLPPSCASSSGVQPACGPRCATTRSAHPAHSEATPLLRPSLLWDFSICRGRLLVASTSGEHMQVCILACVHCCSQGMSFSYSLASKFVMPPLTPVLLCISHHSIILSYAFAASSSLSKQPVIKGHKDVA